MLDDCDELGALREMSMRSLKSAMDSEEYKSGLAKTKEYRDSLETGYLEDEEFSRVLAACKRALKEQREAEESAERQRALMKKLAIAGAAVTAVVLLIAAGLWIRSNMNASALADAVQQQQWDAALAIDSQHVPALIGRANERLSLATPDIEGAFADISSAEQVDSTVAELKPAKALAHAKRAASLATDGKITDAEKELKEAVTLGASSSQLTPVRKLLAAAYVKQAEDAVQSGTAAQVVASVSKAVEYDKSTAIPPAVLLTRVQATITSDLSAASSDYIAAIDLGVPASDSQALRDQLVTALTARCRQSLGSQDVAKASADYASVAKLDSQAASSLAADFAKLPASVLSQLPPRKNSIGIEFKLLPGGVFTMGEGNETPHQVTLTNVFELGVYEVTQEQYEAVMGENPSRFKGAQNPVEKVSWDDAVEFCRQLSALPAEKASGYVYRLPTEAEWEYACRAGTTTVYSFGDSDSELGDYAWYDKNSGKTTHPVGGRKPNAWGLYDMHGNVWEWCQDRYGDLPSGSVTDPLGASSGSDRVYRGGSWSNFSGICRSAFRIRFTPVNRNLTSGFRVLRSSVK